MWQRVSTDGCQLKVGDVFKVGRYTVVVSQVCLTGEPQVPKLQALEDDDDPVSVSACLCMPELRANRTRTANMFQALEEDDFLSACEQNQNESVPSCRICLEAALEADSDSEMQGDPTLIQAPCSCKGSTGMVHISCLEHWLSLRYGLVDLREDGQYLSFEPPCCEICKTELPVEVSVGSGPDAHQASLLRGLPQVRPPFIVLSMPESKSTPYGQSLIFAPSHSDAVLKIGRSAGAELRVADDVSVSRIHATVALTEGTFVLKDNGAKFQTLIQPTGPVLLTPLQTGSDKGVGTKLQMGRTVLDVTLLDERDASRGKGNRTHS